MTVYLEQYLQKFLRPDGNPVNDFRALGDYSDGGLGLTEFSFIVPDGPNFLISDFTAYMADFTNSMSPNGTPNYAQQDPLAAGITLHIKAADGRVRLDLTDGEPINTTIGWIVAATRYDIDIIDKGIISYRFRWNFTVDSGGFPLQLVPGDRFAVILNDDFSGLLTHFFGVRGTLSSTGGIISDPRAPDV